MFFNQHIKNYAASVHHRLLNKAKLSVAPAAFEDVAAVKVFLGPLMAPLAKRRPFSSIWNTPGPRRGSDDGNQTHSPPLKSSTS